MEIILAWLVISSVVGFAASARGRNGLGWFLLSAALSPLIGLVIILALPSRVPEPHERSAAARGDRTRAGRTGEIVPAGEPAGLGK